MGWFAFGFLYNLRSGNALLRWLQEGLPRVGEKTTLRWLGTSVVELVMAKPKKPFRHLITLIILSPRDVPWFWLLSFLQGRRDTLIFRSDLDTPPPLDLELADPAAWTARSSLKQAAQLGWESQAFQDLQLMAPPGRLAQAAACLADLSGPMRRFSDHYWRLRLGKESPHLEVHIPFPDRHADAGQFVAALQELARAVGESS
jgi:hypothetical protein